MIMEPIYCCTENNESISMASISSISYIFSIFFWGGIRFLEYCFSSLLFFSLKCSFGKTTHLSCLNIKIICHHSAQGLWWVQRRGKWRQHESQKESWWLAGRQALKRRNERQLWSAETFPPKFHSPYKIPKCHSHACWKNHDQTSQIA